MQSYKGKKAGASNKFFFIIVLLIIIVSIFLYIKVSDPLRQLTNLVEFSGKENSSNTLLGIIEYDSLKSIRVNEIVKELEKDFPNDLKVSLISPNHQFYEEALGCSNHFEKRRGLQDVIFNTTNITRNKIFSSLDQLDIKPGVFQDCLDEGLFKVKIENQNKLIEKLDLENLPVVFVNNKKFEWPFSYGQLKEQILENQ